MNWEYALFNVVIIISPVIGGLLYKKTRWPKMSHLIKAITPVALVFILIDSLVANDWWFFNPSFISGMYIYNLPLEEIAFFLTVPFASLFLYHNLTYYLKDGKTSFPYEVVALVLTLSASLSLFNQWWYTLAVTLVSTLLVLKDKSTDKLLESVINQNFFLAAIILTTVFNGYLTARPIVTYNPAIKSPITIGTIPLEDFLFGLILLYLVLQRFKQLCSRSDSNTRPTA